MNPESHSYMEVLHEDSFEYSGDMMLAQDYEDDPGWTAKLGELGLTSTLGQRMEAYLDYFGIDPFDYDPKIHTTIPAPPGYDTREDLYGDNPNYGFVDIEGTWGGGTSGEDETIKELKDLTIGERMATGEYGMEGLTSEMFLGMTEDKAYDYLLATKYGGVLPTVEGKTPEAVEADIRRLLSTYLPKRGQPAAEEVGFLAEQYGGQIPSEYTQYDLNKDNKVDILDVNMADPSQKQTFADIVSSGEADLQPKTISFAESLSGRQAGLAKETAMYSLRGQAGQVRGAGMRAGIAGQEAIGKGFQTSQDVYALAGETAGLGYRKGMYGLEEKAESKWERDFTTFLNSLPPAIG